MDLSNKFPAGGAGTIDLGALEPHDRLRIRIAAASVVQWKVAELAGISESQLSKILSGRKEAEADLLERIDQAINQLTVAA